MRARSAVSGRASRSSTPRVTLRASFAAFSSAGLSSPTCAARSCQNLRQLARQMSARRLMLRACAADIGTRSAIGLSHLGLLALQNMCYGLVSVLDGMVGKY